MNKIAKFGALSKEQVQLLEDEFKVNLPSDYRTFLELYNGGLPTQNYLTLMIPAIGEEIVLGSFLGLNENRNFDLIDWNKEYQDDMPDSSLIIGTEYNSGLIIMINQKNESGVYFWDNAHILDTSSDDLNVYKLCNSFSEFIDNLTLGD